MRKSFATNRAMWIKRLVVKQLIGSAPLPIGDALKYGIAITGAVAAAHSHGVLHRDLKPANIHG